MFFTYKNMRISFSVLIGISFIYFLLSCEWRERSIPLELARADSLILESPDSALVWLEQIEDLENFSRRDKALYYLLLTEAQDKAYRPHTTDSLIAISAGYFEETDDLRRKAKAWFYKGRVNQELNHPLLAQEYYLKALRDEERIDDHALFGRVNNNIGMLYTYQCVYEDALPYQKKAINHFRAISDSIGEAYALRDLGRTFLMLGHQDSAIFCDQTAICLLGSRIVPSAYTELANLYVEEQRLEEAYNLLRTALVHTSDSSERYPIYLVLGDLFRHWGKTDSACYYLRICADSATIPATRAGGLYYLKEIAFERKEWEKNALLSKMYESLRDSLQEAYESETIRRIHSLYNYQHIEEENNHLAVKAAQTEKWVYRAVFIIFALVLLVFLLWHWSRKQEREAEALRRLRERQEYDARKQLSVNVRRIAELEELLRQERTQKDVVRQRLERLSAEKEALELDNREIRLQLDEQEIKDLRMRKTAISGWFHTAENWDAIHENSPQWQELEERVNEVYPAFSQTLRRHCPKLKISELHVCLLVKIGIQVGGMARIMDLSKSAISNIRTRLYEKIFDDKGSADDFDRFILRL